MNVLMIYIAGEFKENYKDISVYEYRKLKTYVTEVLVIY